MAKSNSARRMRPEEYQVNPADRPGWVRGSERLPEVGEQVYCAGGDGTVLAVQGRTGDGSRLLRIRLANPEAAPFFAAASNVLVMPATA